MKNDRSSGEISGAAPEQLRKDGQDAVAAAIDSSVAFIEGQMAVVRFCERVVRNTCVLYDFVGDQSIVFLWRGTKVCETTDAKVREAIRFDLTEEFAIELQKLVFDYVDRVMLDI